MTRQHMGVAGRGGGTNTLPTARDPEQAVVGPFDRERASACLMQQFNRHVQASHPSPRFEQLATEDNRSRMGAIKKKSENQSQSSRKDKTVWCCRTTRNPSGPKASQSTVN